ncbi:MAG: hypothetical protein ABDH28_04140 [Brevinematia bacterium]
MSYTPLDVKTVIFADNLLMKNAVNNPGYASILQSQAKIQMKEKSDIEQNRPTDIVEISRESEKVRRKRLGEDNVKQQQYNFETGEKENKEDSKEKDLVESGGGNIVDIIV